MAEGGSSSRGRGWGKEEMDVGFAKLQGEDFEYYMQTYSIVLGRGSKHAAVDVDLASLGGSGGGGGGGGMNISRVHARIFYDFSRRRFALDVLGKNGCFVEGVLHVPGSPPVKLDSQDLLQIGDKRFYFLLPTRSIFAPRRTPAPLPTPSSSSTSSSSSSDEEEDDNDNDEEEEEKEVPVGGYGRGKHVGFPQPPDMGNKSEPRSTAYREADNLQLLQLEEKDVASCVATVLSHLCGPGEQLPMAKLHAELCERYSNIWHHGRVRRYLTSEDWPQNEMKGKPWLGLLTLLRKYPEHFVTTTRSKGRVTSEFVSLVPFVS